MTRRTPGTEAVPPDHLAGGPPAGLPRLSRGSHHHDPARGACVMEYTAVLTGSRFTDRPRCTHPSLAELARQVNDRIGDHSRDQLVSRAPQLAAAGPRAPGVAAAAAGAALRAAADSPGRCLIAPCDQRRMRRLRRRDRPGRGWWGRHRDTLAANDLIRGAFSALGRATTPGAARDRTLIDLLDRALTEGAATTARESSTPPGGLPATTRRESGGYAACSVSTRQ